MLAGDDSSKDFQSRRTHFLLGRLLVKTGRKEEGEKELKIARELQEKSIQSARDDDDLDEDEADPEREMGLAEPDGAEVTMPFVSGPKVGRNEPCPCGSGKKFKNCCGRVA